ncbi:translation initiation factor eIF 4e-like domain-containing protein [Mycena capillaripes]|nr:translation initiation factor eIF 4e-like domain-containing protein [Mycena capillaripes]
MSTPSYFSNHSSQSRFLAISAASAASANTSSHPSSVNPASVNTASAPPTTLHKQTVPGRARATSKHFSTSVAGEERKGGALREEEEVALGDLEVPRVTVHPLRNTWLFWFRQQRAPGNKLLSYEEGIKRVAAFSSVESFWALHTHLAPPSGLTPTTDYLLFHSGITRPVWEDPLNIAGGKWIIRLRKGVADRVWEALLCAVVGDAFAGVRDLPPRSWEDDDDPSDSDAPSNASHATPASSQEPGTEGEDIPEICGCTISVRASEDIVSLWNRVDQDVRVRERIRDTLRTVLGLPPATVMEYKSNNDSMQDKSSFRNSAIERTPLA